MFSGDESQDIVNIVIGCEVDALYGGYGYSVAKDEQGCDLVVDNASKAQRGSYTCRDSSSKDKPVSARLEVLGTMTCKFRERQRRKRSMLVAIVLLKESHFFR